MNSIIQERKECYACHTTHDLECHHIFRGAYRTKSEKYGLKVWLCNRHHTGADGVHTNNTRLDLRLKETAQQRFEELHSHDEFMRQFGRNWLTEERTKDERKTD